MISVNFFFQDICIYDLISEAEERTIKNLYYELLVIDRWVQYLQVLKQGKKKLSSVWETGHM